MGDAVDVYENEDLLSSFAHLALCGCSGYAISQISAEDHPFAFCTACVFFGQGFIGVACKYHTSLPVHQHLKVVYRWTRLVAHSFSLPLINAEFSLQQKQDQMITHGYLASALPPVANQVGTLSGIMTMETEHVLDLVVLGNIASLGYVSLVTEDYLGLAMAGMYLTMDFVVPHVAHLYSLSEFDEEDLKTACLSGVSVLMAHIFNTAVEEVEKFKFWWS